MKIQTYQKVWDTAKVVLRNILYTKGIHWEKRKVSTINLYFHFKNKEKEKKLNSKQVEGK